MWFNIVTCSLKFCHRETLWKYTNVLETVRNVRTAKLFIVLERDSAPGRIRVINPDGQIVEVTQLIFEPDPVFLDEERKAVEITASQLATFNNLQNQDEQRSKILQDLRQGTIKTPVRANPRDSETKSTKTRRSGPVDPQTGKVIYWESERLTFYRHKIDPLKPGDAFEIKLANNQKLKMTKAKFFQVFNHVVMSAQYRSQGYFTFEALPDEAKDFLS